MDLKKKVHRFKGNAVGIPVTNSQTEIKRLCLHACYAGWTYCNAEPKSDLLINTFNFNIQVKFGSFASHPSFAKFVQTLDIWRITRLNDWPNIDLSNFQS